MSTEQPQPFAAPNAATSDPDTEAAFLRAFGQFLCNAPLYGITHTVPMTALDESYTHLRKLAGRGLSLVILLGDESLDVNGHTHILRNPLLQAIAKRMRDMNMTGLTFDAALTPDEYAAFARLLMEDISRDDSASLNARLSAAGVQSVHARKLVMKAIEEGQVVVDADHPAVTPETAPTLDAHQRLIRLLRGEIPSAEAAAGILPDGDQPEALANALSEAIATAPFASTPQAMVKQALEWLTAAPTMRTQKARKRLAAALAELDDLLPGQIAQRTGQSLDQTARQELRELLSETREELQVEALAGDYARKQRAIAESQKRLLRYLKKRGATSEEGSELRQRLLENGLTDAEWFDLLIRHPLNTPAQPAPPNTPELQRALEQLTQLGATTGPRASPAEEQANLAQLANRIGLSLAQTAANTERRIRDIAGRVRAAGGDRETQKRLMRELAEIVQELRQPLSVILCTLEMLAASTLGNLSPSQHEVVLLGIESGRRIDTLIERMGALAGLPDSLTPDATILSQLYGDEIA